MEKITSLFAIGLSVIALLFGGFMNAEWTRKVDAPQLSASVGAVSYDVRKTSEQPIAIPRELVQATAGAQFFPTLSETMSRAQIEEIKKKNDSLYVPELELLASNLTDAKVDDAAAGRLWNAVPMDAKTSLFTYRSIHKLRNALPGMDPADLVALLSEKNEDKSSSRNTFMENPIVKRTLLDAAAEIVGLQQAPSKAKLTAILNDELPSLRVMVGEYVRFIPRLDELISTADRTASTVSPMYWSFSVVFYNAGGSPASVLPAAVAAFRTSSQKNATLPLAAADAFANVVVEPGKATPITFRSVEVANQDLSQSLMQDFKTGERDFRLVFRTADGHPLISAPSNFSARVGEAQRQLLTEEAEHVVF
jgi:hypothetical protein